MKQVRQEDVKRTKGDAYHRPDPPRWKKQIFRVIAEQVAIPMDLLAGFMGVDYDTAVRTIEQFASDDWVYIKRFFVNDEKWVWLTPAGARSSGTNFLPKHLTVASLPHYRAICAVRLALEAEYPDGEWICEREMWRQMGRKHHVPDAVYLVRNADGKVKRWAIEVERTQKSSKRYAEIVAHRCANYHRVLYYCTPQIARKFKRIPEFRNSRVLVIEFFKENHQVKNFQWQLSPSPDLTKGPIPREIEPWQAAIVRLFAEQNAMPMDQFARFARLDVASAKAVADHLREAGLIAEGVGPVDEGPWLWVTTRGARLAKTGLKADPPSFLTLGEIRLRNEARLFAQALYPDGEWWSWRMLLQGNRGATLPAGLIRRGNCEYAVEIEPEPGFRRSLIEKYERRYAEHRLERRRVLLLCPSQKVELFEELKEACGWTKLTVKACPAFDPATKPRQPRKPRPPQSTRSLVRVAIEDLPEEIFREIESMEGAPPTVKLAGRRQGRGFPRWRVTTERNVWRVTENSFKWTIKPAGKKERAERLLPPQPKRREKPRAPEGSLPLARIDIDDVPERALQEIHAKEGAPPKVKLAAKRLGSGHHRWRITTERNVWRVTRTPWGWNIKPSGPKERAQALVSPEAPKRRAAKAPPRRPLDPPGLMREIDPSELPDEVLEAIQKAAGSPIWPSVRSASKRRGSGARRWRVETDMETWSVVFRPQGWSAHLSE